MSDDERERQEEGETELQLQLSELENTGETYMSQQSDLEASQDLLPESSSKEGGAFSVNSSMEVEDGDHSRDISASPSKRAAENSPRLSTSGQPLTEGDMFADEVVSPKEEVIRKRKVRQPRSDDSSPEVKRPRRQVTVDKKHSFEVDKKHSFEVDKKHSFEGAGAGEVPVINISSTPEASVLLDDSHEFSLRIEDSSQPADRRPDSQDEDSWKSHLKRERNLSPGHNSPHHSKLSWVSHHSPPRSFAALKKENEELKTAALKKENEALKKEIEELKKKGSAQSNNVSFSPDRVNKDFNSDGETNMNNGRGAYDDQLVHLIARVQWPADDKVAKLVSAEITQVSLMENAVGSPRQEKMSRLSMTSTTSHKSSSSSGSVGLPGPFPLPKFRMRESITSTVSSSSSGSLGTKPGWDGVFLKPSAPGSKTVVAFSCCHCKKPYTPVDHTHSPVVNGSPLSDEVDPPKRIATPRRGRKPSQNSQSSNVTRSSNTPPTSVEEETSSETVRHTGGPAKRGRGARKTPYPYHFNFKKNKLPTIAQTPPSTPPKKGRPRKEPVVTPTTTEQPFPSPTKNKPKGDPVLARWNDGRFYPGWVRSPPYTNGAVMVHFCDGQSKQTPVSRVVRAQLITPGTLVLMGNDQAEYEEALVVETLTEGEEPVYMLERDSVTKQVGFAQIALLESQKAELVMTADQRAASITNFNDLSLENIVDGPRKRVIRAPPQDMVVSVPTSLKKKRRQQTPEPFQFPKPSTSHGQEYDGPDEYYVDTDSSTHSSCSFDLRGRELKPLDVECSPPELDVNSKNKLSLYCRKMTTKSKTHRRQDEPEHLVQLLGPIPQEGSRIFQDCVFLITYTDQVQLRDDVRTSTAEDASELEDPMPINKERLRTQIRGGGGKVYSALSQVTEEELPNTYLITDKCCNTPLYLQCLVNNIPIYSTNIIIRCCAKEQSFKEVIAQRGVKRLPAGYSLAKCCNVAPRSTQPLKGKTVLFALTADDSVAGFWELLVKKLGGTAETFRGDCLEKKKYNVVVTDADCDAELVSEACAAKVPLVCLTWLQQVIINGDYRSPTEHPSYKYNYSYGAASPEY